MGIIKRQGIKNIVITYVGVIIGAISAIFLQPAFLTTTELGFTRNLYNFSFLLSIALPLGLPNIILRFFPQYKQNDNLKKYFVGFILFYLLIAAFVSLLVFLLFKPLIMDLYKADSQLFVAYFFCVIPYSFIIALSTCLTCFSQAVYKSTVPSFLNDVFSRVMVVVITVLYYYKLISFDLYVLLFVLIYLMVSIILLIYLQHFGLVSFKIKSSVLKQLDLKKLIPYGLIMCLISFTSYGIKSIDAIFLGVYSLSNVAVYSTAVFLALFIEVPLGSIERISHSRISENFSTGNLTETGKIYSESVKYLLIFGGYIFLGICACSKFIFDYLPGAYSESAYLVQILGFGCLVNVATGVNNAILFYTNYFKVGAILLVSAFVFNVIFDIIFIPVYGMLAAAVITTTVSVIYNLSKFLMIYKLFRFQPYDLNSFKIALLILVGFGITLIIPSFTAVPILNILINGSIISVFYIFCVYKLKIIPEIFATITSKFARSR